MKDKKELKALISKNGIVILIILGLLGVAFLSFPSEEKVEEEITAQQEDELSSLELEDAIVRMAEQIEGAGRVSVSVTLESSESFVYARKGEGEPLVISVSGGGQTAVVEKVLHKQVLGVVVVCDGAEDSTVSLNILNAVMTLLDISSTKVCIIKMA